MISRIAGGFSFDVYPEDAAEYAGDTTRLLPEGEALPDPERLRRAGSG